MPGNKNAQKLKAAPTLIAPKAAVEMMVGQLTRRKERKMRAQEHRAERDSLAMPLPSQITETPTMWDNMVNGSSTAIMPRPMPVVVAPQRAAATGLSRSTTAGALRTAVRQVKGHLSALDAKQQSIALAMALPLSFPPTRVASIYSSSATSVARPYAIRSCNWSTPGGETSKAIADGSMLVCLSRNPMRALLQWTPNPGNKYYEGQLVFTDINNLATLTLSPFIYSFTYPSCVGVAYPLPVQAHADRKIGQTAFFHPHGPYVFAGHHENRRGVWVDGHNEQFLTKAGFFLTATTGGGGARAVLYMLVGEAWDMVSSVGVTGGVEFVLECVRPGYYAIEILDFTTTGVIGGFVRSASSAMGHWHVPGMDTKFKELGMIRTTAASLMLSCAASNMNAQGVVAGVQLKPGQSWMDCLAADPVAEVLKVTGGDAAVQKNLKTGLYGWHRPMSEHALMEQTPTRFNNYGAVDVTYPLIETDGWLVIAATTAATATNVYAGADCYVTACWGVEFASTDMWFGTRVPECTPEDFEAAVRALRNLETWHENPSHFSQVVNFLKHAGSGLLHLAPKFLQALRIIAPEVAVLAEVFDVAHGVVNHAWHTRKA